MKHIRTDRKRLCLQFRENITDKITANLAENTEYVLVETTAPENYAIMNPIFFTVNANGQIVLSDNTREDVKVHNNDVSSLIQTFGLPS